MQDASMTKRIFIATFISFIFFMAYDYFYIQPNTQKAQEIIDKSEKKVVENSTPKIEKNAKINTQPTITTDKVIATIKAKNFEAKIDNLGRISSFILLEEKFNKDGKQIDMVSGNLPKPLEIRFSDKEINKEAFTISASSDKKEVILDTAPQTIVLTQKLKALTVTKTIKFYPNGHYDLDVKLSKEADYFISNGFRPDVEADIRAFYGSIIKKSDDTIEMIDDGDAQNMTFKNAKIAASSDMYYTTFLYNLNGMDVYETSNKDSVPILYIKGEKELSLHGYIGPKYVDVIKTINPELVDVVEYGVITFMARPLFYVLHWCYEIVHDWGLAIILLTILIRIVLFPLTLKGMISMYKLKELAPKLKEIQQKYKNDKQKLQVHMMKLYQEEKANPLGGCLPMLLQIPIFFAIYRLLLNSIELKGTEFLWLSDLSLMDPYFILPVLMGVSMYIHQLITPNNFQDPMQEKIFKFLPVIFTFFFIYFPAGLVLYWTINNILSIVQQFIINKVMAAKGHKK
jgi:YidC/Oxa1 family membrane protein insertase